METTPRWLLLAHQLGARSSNARVKAWRRLQQVGAVPVRSSVYVLPNTEACREDFEWLRKEIVADGGGATVFSADAISDAGTEDIVAVFQRTRDEDYAQLKREADRLLKSARTRKTATPDGRQQLGRTVRLLRDRLAAIEQKDFFSAERRADAVAALAALDRLVDGAPAPKRGGASRLNRSDFQNRRWVTRRRPGVDRMSSAWLIRRFIDPKATFAFVDTPSADEVPFDMYSGDFSHHGDRCTFEVLVDRFGIADPAVRRIGPIVHDLDMKESKYGLPETAAIGRMVEGLRGMHPDDGALLEHGIGMFEALSRS